MREIKLFMLVLFFISCSKDEVTNSEIELQATHTSCFEVNNEVVNIGEEVKIVNCSEGAVAYEYDFGNGIKSNEVSPTISYSESGSFYIELKTIDTNGNIKLSNKLILVQDIRKSYLFPPALNGDRVSPIDFGINNGHLYYIETYGSVGGEFSNLRYHYKILNNDNSFETKFLMDRRYHSGNAFTQVSNTDNQSIYITASFDKGNELLETHLDAGWNILNTSYDNSRVLYGVLTSNTKSIYYGSYRNSDQNSTNPFNYHSPAIQIKDEQGNQTRQIIYNSLGQGFIGDLIETSDGFIAFGGSMKPISYGEFEEYKHLLLFLNKDYEPVQILNFDMATKDAIDSFTQLNTKFNIAKLANNKIALYGGNELLIIHDNKTIKREEFTNQSSVQGLVSIDDSSFIISTKNYLKKYDQNGDLIKEIYFHGESTPNLLLKNNQIFFASKFFKNEIVGQLGSLKLSRIFIGSVDTNLNVIDLNTK